MKFFLKNKLDRSFVRKLSTKVLFMPFSASVFLILGLIFNVFINPATAHAGFFSDVASDIAGGISAFSPEQAQADTPADSTSSDSDIGSVTGTGDVLAAAINSDPSSSDNCVSDITSDDTISPESDSCSSASTTNTEISTYIVRPGDTLSEIAGLFGVSVNTIVWVNDLDRTAPLQTGETLVILPVSGIQYTIKKGDTVQSIATHYGVDADEILQYNDITLTSVLNPGDTIIIPDAALEGSQSVSAPSKSSGGKKGGIPPKSQWGAPGTEPAHNTNGPSYPGYYNLPLVSGTETQGLHGYNAVDLAAPRGTPIFAAADGTVIISIGNGGWNGGYGNYVVINHPNGTQTLYAHMSKVIAKVGETVSQCQEIGLVGATGEATGPHVHFEVHGARNPFADIGTFSTGDSEDCN